MKEKEFDPELYVFMYSSPLIRLDPGKENGDKTVMEIEETVMEIEELDFEHQEKKMLALTSNLFVHPDKQG